MEALTVLQPPLPPARLWRLTAVGAIGFAVVWSVAAMSGLPVRLTTRSTSG